MIELSVSNDPALHGLFLRQVSPEKLPSLGAISQLIDTVATPYSPIYSTLRERLVSFRPVVVANQVLRGDERRISHALTIVCRQYLGIEPFLAAGLPNEPTLAQNIRRMKAPISLGVHGVLLDLVDALATQLVEQVPFEPSPLMEGLDYASDQTVWLKEKERQLRSETQEPASLTAVLDRLPQMASQASIGEQIDRHRDEAEVEGTSVSPTEPSGTHIDDPAIEGEPLDDAAEELSQSQ